MKKKYNINDRVIFKTNTTHISEISEFDFSYGNIIFTFDDGYIIKKENVNYRVYVESKDVYKNFEEMKDEWAIEILDII